MSIYHEESGYRYAGAVIFLLTTQWLAVIGRLIGRAFFIKKLGWDDAALVVTLFIATVYDAIALATIPLTEGGIRGDRLPLDQLIPAIKLGFALDLIYIWGTFMLKISCGMLLLRVLVRRWQIWIIHGCIAFSVVYGVAWFFFILFECGSPKNFATRSLAGEKCLSAPVTLGLSYTHSTIVATIDLIFVILPIALIRSTKLARRAKISLAAILSLGSATVIATFARFAYIKDLIKPDLNFFKETQPLAFLSSLEMSIGIICISLSTYRCFFKSFYLSRRTQNNEDEESFGSPEALSPVTKTSDTSSSAAKSPGTTPSQSPAGGSVPRSNDRSPWRFGRQGIRAIRSSDIFITLTATTGSRTVNERERDQELTNYSRMGKD